MKFKIQLLRCPSHGVLCSRTVVLTLGFVDSGRFHRHRECSWTWTVEGESIAWSGLGRRGIPGQWGDPP